MLLDKVIGSGRRLPVVVECKDSLKAFERAKGRFDLVMGNPAFGKVKKTAEMGRKFARSLYGHPNLYRMLTDVAIHLAKPQGGVIANSGGLVTLDIVQVVSNVDTSITTQVNSPAFLERTVQSRVVVQDEQTVGLAGLIQDSATQTNQGFPWIKDIPLIGTLFGQQNNNRSRSELLVLITPHVIHDQRDARALTEDLRDQMRNAAVVPQQLQNLKADGSPDPNEQLRRSLGLH